MYTDKLVQNVILLKSYIKFECFRLYFKTCILYFYIKEKSHISLSHKLKKSRKVYNSGVNIFSKCVLALLQG
jgi:hypothetical protein